MTTVNDVLEKHSNIWKTESAFMSYIRGGVRGSLWKNHPVKITLINSKRMQIPNPNPKGKKPTVWGGCCEICNNLFISSEMQVDHIRESGSSLKTMNDIQQFIEDMVVVTVDDLRWVCKGCHSIVSMAQKNAVSFEEAKADKEAKRLVDNKLDIKFLQEHNVEQASTQAKRRKQIYEILVGGVCD